MINLSGSVQLNMQFAKWYALWHIHIKLENVQNYIICLQVEHLERKYKEVPGEAKHHSRSAGYFKEGEREVDEGEVSRVL